MKQKKGKDTLNCNKYISRVSNQKSIENIVSVIKEFLKDAFNIKYEYTFRELQEIVRKRRIFAETPEKFDKLCERFEHLEYRPTKPTKKEINKVKALVKEMIKESCHEETEEKKTKFDKIKVKAEEIKKKTEKHKDIAKKIESVKQKITKAKIKEVKKNISHEPINIKKDKECKEISRFISTSIKLDIKTSEIKKELREMGFQREKIELVISKIIK